MIEMQYNFPLLAQQGEQWQRSLAAAVSGMSLADPGTLRPSFRASDPQALVAQRTAAAEWLGADPACTHITCGTHHGMLISLMAAGIAGRPIAVEAVTYTAILEQARMLASPLVACAFDEEGITPEALASACAAAAAAGRPIAALYTMPTVHNPLGCVATIARRQAIVAVARAHDLLIVEDDAYGFMEAEAPPTYGQLAAERTFYIRGLSKSYAPAVYTGFLVAPTRFSNAVALAIKNSSSGTALPQTLAALSLIADGVVDRVIALKRAEGGRRNAAARRLFAAAGLRHLCPAAAVHAWHLWATLPAGYAGPRITPQAFEARMASRGVAVSGGNWFLADPADTGNGNGFRIALGGEVDADRTHEGVRLVVETLVELST